MNEKEVKSILINKLGFSQDALYKIDIFCRELIKYNQKFNLIAKFCRSYKIVIKVTHKSYIYPPEESALTVHSHQGN